ncbi:MAG: SPOR domain-containing protein [Sutterella sp.]|nr:SPOR domain-containing protein [Sutterella sp.]
MAAKGGFATGFAGFLIGVVTGLAIAAAAAILITKSPVPFVNKVDKVTADVDPAAKLAGGVDPNARLQQRPDEVATPAAPGRVKTVDATGSAAQRDADGKAVAPGEVRAVTYWVQVASLSSESDAQNHAAQLAMNGIAASVTRSGPHWRVRVGPFDERQGAEEVLGTLTDQGLRPVIVEQK